MIIVIIIIIVSVFPLKMTTLGEMSYQLGKISQWNIPVISPKSRVVYPTDLRGCCGRCILFRRQGFWDCWLSRKRVVLTTFPLAMSLCPVRSVKHFTFLHVWSLESEMIKSQQPDFGNLKNNYWWIRTWLSMTPPKFNGWDFQTWIFGSILYFTVSHPFQQLETETSIWLKTHLECFSSGKWFNFETSPAGYHPQG